MKKQILAIMAMCVGIGSGATYAQDTRTDNHQVTINIPEVALLDLEATGAKNITMAFTAPTEAGDPIAAPTPNTNLWINYSSIVASVGETSRKVTVQITSGTVPSGASLTVTPQAPTGGVGTLGTQSGALTLSTTAQDIVTGIGSGYTENGANKGHNLHYGLAITNYANLKHDATGSITVTYTITDV